MQTSTPDQNASSVALSKYNKLRVQQVHEIGELLGFETRNKYQVFDENNLLIAYAAEQQKGIWNLIVRQYLGHWRKFDVHFFTPNRTPFMVAHHPFRFFFERIEVRDTQGRILGAIQKRFAFFAKRFDVENERGMVVMEVASPIWKIWSFAFKTRDRVVANVNKKWSGFLSEAFTDKDNFMVDYADPNLNENERKLVMAAAVFIDLMYFEKKS